jgi:ribonuclease G
MYDVDDAVAKIDGYIISIAGASPHVGEKRMVRIDQVGRTAASALLLDESGEVVTAPVRAIDTRANTLKGAGGRGRRRSPAAAGGGRGAAERAEPRARRRRASVDSEDAQTRREAGLSESPTAIDSEPEQEPAVELLPGTDAVVAVEDASREGADEPVEDGLQSKPRRRGRRGGRRRSAAKAKATPE